VLIAFGIVLILIGFVGLTGTLPFLHRLVQFWPREVTKGDVSNLVASSFIFRFMSLLFVCAGIALIVIALV
jgi:hypothetical protein